MVSSAAQADPIARCTIYRLFSGAFKYPTPDAFQEYRDGVFLAELWDNMSALYYMLPMLQEKIGVADRIQLRLQRLSYRDLAAEFTRTFEPGVGGPACFPFEGFYRQAGEKQALLNELLDFYEQFGLRIDKGTVGWEAPDHVSVEFEFLHYLAFKEAQARQEAACEFLGGYVLAERDFLKRHLTAWLPAFSQNLQKLAPTSFFSVIAGLAERFTSLDFEVVCSASGARPPDLT